jgi:multidrug resistance efflux pump
MIDRQRSARPPFASILRWAVALQSTAVAVAVAASGEAVVERGLLIERQLLSGRVAAARAVDLAAPDVGIYPLSIRWLAENGARVDAGDRLIELDNSALVSRLNELELEVVRASTGLETAVASALAKVGEAEFELLQKRVAHQRALVLANVPEGLKSELEYARLKLDAEKAAVDERTATTRVGSARTEAAAEIEIARLALEKAEVALATSQSKIERMTVTAPAAGIVQLQQNPQQDRLFRPGDSTFPGATILRLPDPHSLLIEAELYDVDDGDVSEGSAAMVVLDALPERTLRGVVTEIGAVAQQRSRASLRRAFAVRVALEQSDTAALRPGMSARVSVERRIGCGARAGEPCLLVDRSALDLRRPDAPVATLTSGDARAVTIGACDSRVCVVRDGLVAGDRVKIVNGAVAAR